MTTTTLARFQARTRAQTVSEDLGPLRKLGFCEKCATHRRIRVSQTCPRCAHLAVDFLDRDPRRDTPTQALLNHMRLYYSDWAIAHSLDCVLAEVTGYGGIAVRKYARLRRGAPDFRPLTKTGHNNHAFIPAHHLRELFDDSQPVTKNNTMCERCQKNFVPRRSTARFCSGACQRKAHRMSR